jgi:glycerol-1-phosphate dehydrogenase [NAD(P)+]
MSTQREILASALRDAHVTRDVEVGVDVLAALPALALRHAGGSPLLVVADDNTWSAAGASVFEHFAAAGLHCAEPLILRETPRVKPETGAAKDIANHLRAAGCVAVAVGSGVINDLVKYASALNGRPYLCVATAASMDGYAASGAALLDGGFKRTLPCDPPVAVVADTDVLALAPARMARWG